MVGAGLKGCATGLFVCPLGFDPVLKSGGRLGLLAGCGLGALGRTGLEETGRLGSGFGFGCGLGAKMERIAGFFSTVKGFGVSLGLGPGTGLLGSEGIISGPWVPPELSTKLLLLESMRGLRCRRLPTTHGRPASTSTWAAIAPPETRKK